MGIRCHFSREGYRTEVFGLNCVGILTQGYYDIDRREDFDMVSDIVNNLHTELTE